MWSFQMREQWERSEIEVGVQVCECSRMKVMKK